jgi:hypothetical protein
MGARVSDIRELLQAVQDTPVAQAIAASAWLYPTIETVHVLALTLVVGSIAMLDLRLIGAAHRDRTVTRLAAEVLPFTWVSFAFAVLSGALLFSSAAVKLFDNTPMRIKMALLVLAGINMGLFHLFTWRDVHRWDGRFPTPMAAKLAGGASLALWVGVVFFGRWIGFV